MKSMIRIQLIVLVLGLLFYPVLTLASPKSPLWGLRKQLAAPDPGLLNISIAGSSDNYGVAMVRQSTLYFLLISSAGKTLQSLQLSEGSVFNEATDSEPKIIWT